MKNTNFRNSLKQKLTLAALTGIIALPTLVTVPALQADPQRNAPAWGQRDDNNNNNKASNTQNKFGNGQNKPGNDDHNKPGRNNNAPSFNRDNNGPGRNGFDASGFDRDGRDGDGRDRSGFDRNGFDRNGFDHNGYDRNGHDRNGHDRNWHRAPVGGFNNPGNWNDYRPGFGGGYNGNYGDSLTITGTVIDSQNREDTLRIRADDGRVYLVPTGSARYFYVGNRIRVSGRLDGGTLLNANVSRQ